MSSRIQNLKLNLARVFDDNMHTKQWHNIVDWLIVFMILISTTEIFLSTFDIDPTLRRVLWWVDLVTLIFFTIEVCLRIWVAPVVNPKYKGLKGRLKYCFTFYGAIDVLSTFPFYLQWIFPLPVAAFKMLRTARVVRTMRIGRYSKSFNLLSNAIKEKRRELIVSMQFLIVITVILSLVLFFAEHEEQPDVYRNGFISVIWAFAQYIGDPGQFADTPPITGVGRVIACIVGLLGIAIVAVPAGIIGAGFTEALEKEAKKNQLEENSRKMLGSFQRKLDRPSQLQVVRPFITFTQLQARCGLKADEVFDVINSEKNPQFRLINTASTIPNKDQATDMLALENYLKNRSYGLFIDRGSTVTIVNPSAFIDAGTGNFSFYLALLGGFNYISREVGDRSEFHSYFIMNDHTEQEPEFHDFKSDLSFLMSRPGAWSVVILCSSGALEPVLPTHLHFGTGGRIGQENFSDVADPLIKDRETFEELYHTISTRARKEFGLECDENRYYATHNPKMILRNLDAPHANHIVLRIEWHKMIWDPRYMLICKMLTESLSEIILHRPLPDNPILKVKNVGFEDYLQQ